ncbi:MAG: hypothetical protein ABSA84_03830 [Gammaproteobacteria bacterium]|jgi:hypothetical protein
MKEQSLQNAFLTQTKNFQQILDIINGFPGITYWVNKEGIYIGHNVFSNKDLQEYKIPPNLAGKSVGDIFPSEVTKYYMDCIIESIDSDVEVIKNKTYSTTGEKLQAVLYYNRPLKDENTKTIGAIGNIIDVDYFKKTSIRLLSTNNSLDKQTKAMLEICYGFSNSFKESFEEVLLLIKHIETNTTNNHNKELITEMKNYLKILLNNCNDVLKSN